MVPYARCVRCARPPTSSPSNSPTERALSLSKRACHVPFDELRAHNMVGVSAKRGFLRHVEPGVEKRIEVLSGHPLGESDELGRRHISVLMLLCPAAQDDE